MRRALLLLGTALLAAPAIAQDAGLAPVASAPQGSPWGSALPLLMIFVVFYFMLIRPQGKRYKEHQNMLLALKKGDKVVTAGGVVGKVTKVTDDLVHLEIASGVEVVAIRQTIASLHGETAKAAQDQADQHKSSKGKKKSLPLDNNDNVVPKRESVANDN